MSLAAAPDAPDLGESALVCQFPLGRLPEDLIAWIDNASRGDSTVYFIGHLAVARDKKRAPFGSVIAEAACDFADITMRAEADGRVELAQKRYADGCFLYRMRKR